MFVSQMSQGRGRVKGALLVRVCVCISGVVCLTEQLMHET